MRRLRQTGFTLVELCVVVSIIAILMMAALPNLADYVANSRLRESANILVSTALYARSEAIKRNAVVRVDTQGQSISVLQIADGVSTSLRTLSLPDSVTATAFQADFTGAGRLTPFGTAVTVALSSASRPCDEDVRCPSVIIDAGGAVSQCFAGSCP